MKRTYMENEADIPIKCQGNEGERKGMGHDEEIIGNDETWTGHAGEAGVVKGQRTEIEATQGHMTLQCKQRKREGEGERLRETETKKESEKATEKEKETDTQKDRERERER